MDERAGRVLSAKNEKKLKDALQALSDVLAQLDDDDGRAVRGLLEPFEQRTVSLGDVEVRDEDGQSVVGGYAAVFNQLSVPLYGFREQIAPGAFAESLSSDVRALWQHDTSRVLGRTVNGSLRLWEDERGLGFELQPPDTRDGQDAIALIRRGDVDQMSFGFTVPKGGDEWNEDGDRVLRTLNKVDLIEISPVTFPAYLGTSADIVRHAPEWVQRALALGADDIEVDDSTTRARYQVALLRRKLQLYLLGEEQ